MGNLTVKFVESVKATDKKAAYGDGDALELHVEPTKRKSCTKKWIARFRWDGKANSKTLGQFPATSLTEARKINFSFREHLDQGLHPALFVPPQMALKAKAVKKRYPETPSLPDAPENWIVAQYVEKWLASNPNWAENTLRTKRNRAKKYLVKPHGNKRLRDITHEDIQKTILALTRTGKHAQAKKIAGVWRGLFEYAEAHDKTLPNVAGKLDRYLQKDVEQKNHPAITEPTEVGELLLRLEEYKPGPKGTKALQHTIFALRLLPYTLFRPHEICEGKWTEINFQERVWTKNRKDTKTKKNDNICPICDQAYDILLELHKMTGDDEYLFPGQGRKKPHIVPETLRKLLLEGLGYKVGTVTTHGFRGMGSTLLNENGFGNFECIEKQLSHRIGSRVSQAYNHATYIKQRAQMMQELADYLDELKHAARLARVVSPGQPSLDSQVSARPETKVA